MNDLHDVGSIPDRRQEDQRLREVENNITYIKAKLDNGLTHRSIHTAEQLDHLVERHNGFEVLVHKALSKTDAKVEQIDNKVTNITAVVEKMADIHHKWNRSILRMLWFGVVTLCGAVTWIVLNADLFATIIANLSGVKS